MSEDMAPVQAPAAARSRGWVAVAASALVVVLVAVGGYAAWGFLSASGPRPAEVLPASTFALVSLDLDPSGGQKVEAIKTLRKFPSWRERTGLSPDSDVARTIFEKAVEGGPCASLEYGRDVEPWIGQRLGAGGVLLGDGTAVPVLALQVKDAQKAEEGFAKLVDCGEPGDDFGWALAEDYVVASDSTEHAEAIVSAGREAPLDADANFQKWTEEAGGAGILDAYLGPDAGTVLAEQLDARGGLPGVGPSDADEERDGVPAALKDFQGGAASLRFADGGIELSAVGGGLFPEQSSRVGDHIGALPPDTAAALAFSVPEKTLAGLTSPEGLLGGLLGGFAAGAGLDLPDDLVTLVGESLSISLGAEAPADLEDVAGLGDLPIGVLVHGDETEIRAVVEKVETATGSSLGDVPATLASSEGKVAVASTPDYADALVADGSLEDSETFRDVVTELGRADAVAYVSLDNAWVTLLGEQVRSDDDAEATEVMDNIEALRAVGVSTWTDGDMRRLHVRISLR